MGCSIIVTETVVREYRFDSEKQARSFLDSGDLWYQDNEVIEQEILDIEVFPDH